MESMTMDDKRPMILSTASRYYSLVASLRLAAEYFVSELRAEVQPDPDGQADWRENLLGMLGRKDYELRQCFEAGPQRESDTFLADNAPYWACYDKEINAAIEILNRTTLDSSDAISRAFEYVRRACETLTLWQETLKTDGIEEYRTTCRVDQLDADLQRYMRMLREVRDTRDPVQICLISRKILLLVNFWMAVSPANWQDGYIRELIELHKETIPLMPEGELRDHTEKRLEFLLTSSLGNFIQRSRELPPAHAA